MGDRLPAVAMWWMAAALAAWSVAGFVLAATVDPVFAQMGVGVGTGAVEAAALAGFFEWAVRRG